MKLRSLILRSKCNWFCTFWINHNICFKKINKTTYPKFMRTYLKLLGTNGKLAPKFGVRAPKFAVGAPKLRVGKHKFRVRLSLEKDILLLKKKSQTVFQRYIWYCYNQSNENKCQLMTLLNGDTLVIILSWPLKERELGQSLKVLLKQNSIYIVKRRPPPHANLFLQ